MIKKSLRYIIIQVIALLFIVTILSSVKIKGVRVWSLLNKNIILKGGQTNLMFSELEKFNPDENSIFVVGSSHAYRGYDPRIFKSAGLELFVLGTSGQNMKDSYTLIKAYKNKIKRLILDIYPGVLQEVTEESTLILIQNVCDNRTALNILRNNITINSINNMASRLFDINEHAFPCQEKYIYNGYVESDKHFICDTTLTYNNFIPGENYAYLDSILLFAKKANIKLWLASHPLKWNSSYKKYYYETYIPQIQKTLCKFPDVEFIDFTLNHSNSDSLFSDQGHLNQSGVSYFNRLLFKKLNLN